MILMLEPFLNSLQKHTLLEVPSFTRMSRENARTPPLVNGVLWVAYHSWSLYLSLCPSYLTKKERKKKRSLWKASSLLYVVRANGAFNWLFSPLAFDKWQDSKGKETESEKQKQNLSTLTKKKAETELLGWILCLYILINLI